MLAWARDVLMKKTTPVGLNPSCMREPSAPGSSDRLLADGSNIGNAVARLRKGDLRSYGEWVGHLQTVLEGLDGVVVEQDHGRGLSMQMLREGSPHVPARFMSGGTLQLLGLTLLAYMPDNEGVFLVEEPEDGMHPQAIEAVFDSLRSVYDGQVFLATHSPLIVGLAEPEQLLCFSRTEQGATHVVRGDQHRRMKHWRCETDLGTLYASGVLDGDG